jgi:hypothetical protein
MKDKVTNILCLANFVRENMRKKQLLTPYHTLLVTLSGGQDSISSLLLLYLLQKQITTKTIVHSGLSPRSVVLSRRLSSENLLSGAKTQLEEQEHAKDSASTEPCFCSRTRVPKAKAPREGVPLGGGPNLFDKCAFFRLIGPFGLLWCNHFWQRDSFHTMLHVAKVNLCFSSPICFYLPGDIESVLCEQDAREWRHKSIQRTCVFFNYEFCTQGHTKSDRVETILFNIMRGTGIAGLQALQWKKSFYSFSCQRFYPRLSYCKLNWPRPLQDMGFCSAPLLKSTLALAPSTGKVPEHCRLERALRARSL